MAKRPRSNLTAEFLMSVAKRAIVTEQQMFPEVTVYGGPHG